MPGGLWGVPGLVSGDPGGSQGRRKNGGGSLGRPGMVLGAPWGGFGGMGRSLGQSWEVRLLLFRRC